MLPRVVCTAKLGRVVPHLLCAVCYVLCIRCALLLQVFVLSSGQQYMLSVQVYQLFANNVTCYNTSATVRISEDAFQGFLASLEGKGGGHTQTYASRKRVQFG